MTKRKIILFGFVVLVMAMGAFVSVSAQDVDNMSNEQLTTLLLQIMQRLDGAGEAAEMPEPTATPTPEPINTPQPELSDDKAELEALMMAIMQKLQQEETQASDNVPTDVPLTDPVPTATMIPVLEPEPMGFSIYENKKLIIEGLPSYMFIQPTKEEPTHGDKTDETNVTEHYYGEPCSRPDVTDRDCFWVDWDGPWACKCPRG